MNIVLIGAPLAGKGTQATLLQQNLGLKHISTGELLREEMRKDTDLGKTVKDYMEKGNLVPDNITIEVLKERLSKSDTKNGVLLDGFPRTLYQAKQLDNIINIDKVVFINVSLENLLKRIAGRYVCSDCKKTNTISEKVTPCIYCGGKLTKRSDDTEETVQKRYATFVKETLPIVEYYKAQNKVIEVIGNTTVEEIYSEIEGRLKND